MDHSPVDVSPSADAKPERSFWEVGERQGARSTSQVDFFERVFYLLMARGYAADARGTKVNPYPRHVWITGMAGVAEDCFPGVLLDWRRDGRGGWEALVVWATGGGRHSAHARIDWLAAHHVTPAR